MRTVRLCIAAMMMLLLSACASSSVLLEASRGASATDDGYRFEITRTWRGRLGSIAFPPSGPRGLWCGALVTVSAATLLDSPTAQVVDAAGSRRLDARMILSSTRDASSNGATPEPPGRYWWSIWFAVPDTHAAVGSALIIKAGNGSVRVRLDPLVARGSRP